jgi:predicted DNA-binding protein with PD1-like motif
VVLGRRDGSTVGGHLLDASVRPTLEVMVIDSPEHLRRACDPVSGIALIRIDD